MSKIKVTGLDVVRSTFPTAFRTFMNKFLLDVLRKTDKDTIDRNVLEFKSNLKDCAFIDIARNTAVKNLSKFDDASVTSMVSFKKGTPAHVKAALSYNALLHHFKLQNKYESIEDGAKIKWVYLTQNPYNLETVAVKGYNDPPQIIELVKTYIDYKALFENELQKKIQDFYSALSWGLLPTEVNQNAQEWFSF